MYVFYGSVQNGLLMTFTRRNATKWPSLTEFAKHLGREGICRVEENEKGLMIAWIDNSPEALRRQEAIRKKERQDKGDEEREQKMIREQIERAEMDADAKARNDDDDLAGELVREEGEKIKLNFGAKAKESKGQSPPAAINDEATEYTENAEKEDDKSALPSTGVPTPPPEKVSLKIGIGSKPQNVFAGVSKKKSALGGKGSVKEIPKRPKSEAERIMNEEIERKRMKEASGSLGFNHKRPRLT